MIFLMMMMACFLPSPFERGWASFSSLRSKGISGITPKGLDAEKSHFPVHGAATLFFRLAAQSEDGCKSWHSFVGIWQRVQQAYTQTLAWNRFLVSVTGQNKSQKEISVAVLGISPQHHGLFLVWQPMEKPKPDVEKRWFWDAKNPAPRMRSKFGNTCCNSACSRAGALCLKPFLPQLPIKVWLAQKTFILWELFCFLMDSYYLLDNTIDQPSSALCMICVEKAMENKS